MRRRSKGDLTFTPPSLRRHAVLHCPLLFPALILGSVIAANAGDGAGQPLRVDDPLRPVDARVGDLGPMSRSLRRVEYGLQEPSGFTQLYQLGDDPDKLLRANGAVYAVFPRSEYRATRSGVYAMIPAGTIFMIGRPHAADDPDAPELPRDTSALYPVPGPRSWTVVSDMPEANRLPRFLEDEQYRRERLAQFVATGQ